MANGSVRTGNGKRNRKGQGKKTPPKNRKSNGIATKLPAEGRRLRVKPGRDWELNAREEKGQHDKIAWIVFGVLVSFAAASLLIVLHRGDASDEKKIVDLCCNIMWGTLGALSGWLFSRRSSRG
jgi:hypothetical protein